MKYFIYSLVLLIFFSVGGFFLRVLLLPARTAGAVLNTIEGTIDKTLTADNAIYNYEWFKKQVEDIKAIETKITIAQKAQEQFKSDAGDRTNWTFEDKNESSRLASITQGLQSQYQDMVAIYNARSNMANRNIFQSGIIPSVYQAGSNFLR